ncbi:MAG: FHA domain-containing protein [Actinomycetales bacterium]|nr:FHA domain-containing protein [Actinomycetales bacterium]
MGLLDSLEARLDKLVNGSFSKAFKAGIEPTELGAVLQQELDAKATEIAGQMQVPNIFIIDLGAEDHARLQAYLEPLSAELSKLATDYSAEQNYVTESHMNVSFRLDDNFGTGVFRINSASGQSAPAAAVANPENISVHLIDDVNPPSLITVAGDRYSLKQSVTKIGRGDQAEIQIDDPGISRLHCAITLGSEIVIRDLGSTNGTMVDGRTVSEAVLHEGSIIKVGSTTLTFSSR